MITGKHILKPVFYFATSPSLPSSNRNLIQAAGGDSSGKKKNYRQVRNGNARFARYISILRPLLIHGGLALQKYKSLVQIISNWYTTK